MNLANMIDRNMYISTLSLVLIFLLTLGTDPMESSVIVLLSIPILIGSLIYGFTNMVANYLASFGIGKGSKSIGTVGSMIVFMLLSIGIFGQLKSQDVGLIALFFIGAGFYVYRRFMTRS